MFGKLICMHSVWRGGWRSDEPPRIPCWNRQESQHDWAKRGQETQMSQKLMICVLGVMASLQICRQLPSGRGSNPSANTGRPVLLLSVCCCQLLHWKAGPSKGFSKGGRSDRVMSSKGLGINMILKWYWKKELLWNCLSTTLDLYITHQSRNFFSNNLMSVLRCQKRPIKSWLEAAISPRTGLWTYLNKARTLNLLFVFMKRGRFLIISHVIAEVRVS